MDQADKLQKIVSLAKRRGFIYPGSEIYGGLSGFYDYGPLGVEMKFNLKQLWWKEIVQKRDDVVGLSAAIVMNPKVWEASGHVSGFSDPLIECPKCHKRFRSDELSGKCLECGTDLASVTQRQFNLMFKTNVGPVEDTASVAYLRPETAGGIFVNFKNVLDSTRIKIPFGIAQVGRAFRNEVNPKDYTFRTREFEQMELEFFVKPGEDDDWFRKWVDWRFEWYQSLGLRNIRKFEQPKEELAHYSKNTTDIEYEFPFGWKEIEGIANRTDFDLKTHSQFSGQELSYHDDITNETYTPYVIEPSAGVDRVVLAFLCESYIEEEIKNQKSKIKMTEQNEKISEKSNLEKRVVLKLHPKLAPFKAAVFPLLANKPQLVEKAREIYLELKQDFNIAWDARGNIGKRYFSQDEIGTPFCFTIDFQTLEDETITIRDRDTQEQKRIEIKEITKFIADSLK